MLKRTLIAAAAALAAGTLFTVPASAEPGDNPCEFAINYVCKFIPIAPDLVGDVDLTEDQPPADPNAPPPRPAVGVPVPVDPNAAPGMLPPA